MLSLVGARVIIYYVYAFYINFHLKGILVCLKVLDIKKLRVLRTI
nr:MAG TPA: hypothetical protein [Caudoviricetes sp.]